MILRVDSEDTDQIAHPIWPRSYKTFFMLELLTTAYSFLLNLAEHENFSANKYENANYCWHFHFY